MSERAGEILRAGHVVVGGRPNVGKSTLFNHFLGKHLSIVTPRRNTTRYCIRGVISEPASQLVLLDTPGWETKAPNSLARQIKRAAAATIPCADVGLLMIESCGLRDDDRRIADQFNEELPLVVAINKSDLVRDSAKMLPMVDELNGWRGIAAVVPVCALNGEGCNALLDELRSLLPVTEKIDTTEEAANRTDAFFIADFIREQIFINMEEEVPYASAVEIKQMSVQDDGKQLVVADILVDRNSRKAMIIGARGAMIKRIGTDARRLIEAHLSAKVYLDLQVKVRRNWANEPSSLARLGMEGGIV